MEEIIGNEFIEYKTGFIAGKSEIIEAISLGKIMNLNDNEDKFEEDDSWYTHGFNDGFNYFSNLINKNKLDLENINTRGIIKECFTKRVIDANKKENSQIPIGKFRL